MNIGETVDLLGYIEENKEFQTALFRRRPAFLSGNHEIKQNIEKVAGILYNDYVLKK
jgi:hypothetical protein